jgi:hypothetical protein
VRSRGHFRHEPSELRAPGGAQALEQVRILGDPARSQRIDPRREGQDLLRLVGAPEQHREPPPGGFRGQLRDEPALADACLPEHGDDPAAAGGGRGEGGVELLHLARASHQLGGGAHARDAVLGHARSVAALGRRRRLRARGPLAEDLLVERLRLRLRLHPQLALEHAHALLVLPERGPPPSLLRVEAHQRSVHGLLQRVQRQQPESAQHRRLDGARLALVCQQPREGLEGELPQPLAFAQQPLLERRLVERQSRQEIALVERARAREGLRRAVSEEPLEVRDIDADAAAIEGNRVPVEREARRGGGRQGLAQGEEGLTQAVAGRLLADPAPEQRSELVAGVGLAEGKR